MNRRFFSIVLALILLLGSGGTKLASGHDTPYVLLISFDGFRWDYLNRGITPNLNKLSDQGVRALSLRSAFPSKTFPNHLSMVTGMYPEHHGIIHNRFLDPFSGRQYRVGDTASVRDSRWYLGEMIWETAGRQGIKSASYFWPGSELRLSYRHPTYFRKYDGNIPYRERVEGIIRWLQLPAEKRPHLLMLYFEDTDTQGHAHGPDSPEVNRAIRRLDAITGYLISRLKAIGMYRRMNIIIVSDHGMTSVDNKRVVNIEEKLAGIPSRIQGFGPVMMVEPAAGKTDRILRRLNRGAVHFRAYRREQMPEWFHFSRHPFISSVVVVADPGWTLITNADLKKMAHFSSGGNHGYDPNYLDMHGLFLAEGPAFKKGYRTGTLWNIDIYPLICRILNIMPRGNIDGRWGRIGFILQEPADPHPADSER